MWKRWIIPFGLLVIVIGAGIVEILFVKSTFEQLETEFSQMIVMAEEKTLDIETFEKTANSWKSKKNWVEFFLNHLDLTEIELRLAEAQAYVKEKDFVNAHAMLCILKEMSRHVPEMTMPSAENVL